MPKKKNKSYRLNISKEFVKTFFVILFIGGIVWGWQNWKSHSKHSSKKPTPSIVKEDQKVSPPSTLSFEALTDLFPKQAWLDDYFQVKVNGSSMEEDILVVALGTAPIGTNPEGIKNPEVLNPELLVVKKNEKGYFKLDQFDFSTNQLTEAGVKGNNLKGLPRITKSSLLNLDKTGESELVVFLDSAGKWTEAVALLKIQNGKLSWIKTKDKKGEEKIALWFTGATATEAQKIIPKDSVLFQKTGKLDANHPEKGFQWKTVTWEYKKGMLREK